MIRVMVISDTHGMNGFVESEIERIGTDNINAIIHAGDFVSDAEHIERLYPQIPVYSVAGNNDIYTRAKGELLVTMGGASIFITHGHAYGVKYDSDYRTLIQRAQALGAQAAVFGHTHTAHLSHFGGIMLLNPGSAGFSNRYAVMEIENSNIRASLI